MYGSLLFCREREEDNREFFFQRKFRHSRRGHLSHSDSKEYVVCRFRIKMQIQIQNVDFEYKFKFKRHRKFAKMAPQWICVVKTELLTFFNLRWSSSVAGSAKVEKNQGLLCSWHSCNKCWGFQPCSRWEFTIRIQVSKVKVAMICNNKTLDRNTVAFPVSQLVETFFAWWRMK